jgi:ABC-2 type transport system permease protein
MGTVAVLAGQTLRVRRSSLLGWSVSLGALVAAFVAMFPSIEEIDVDAIAEQYPEALLQAFGVESLEDLDTPIGFLNLELFGFLLPLAIAFLPVGVIVHALPAAEQRRHLDALLSLPLARWQLVVAATAAAWCALLAAIVVMVAAALATALVGGIDLGVGEMTSSAASLFPLGALTASVAVLVVGAARRHGAATAAAGGVLVVMYLIEVLSSFVGLFDELKGLSAFHYYSDWIDAGIEPVSYVVIVLAAVALTALGAVLFERRDVGG